MNDRDAQLTTFVAALFGGRRYSEVPPMSVEVRCFAPDYAKGKGQPYYGPRDWYGGGAKTGREMLSDAARWCEQWEVYMGVLPRTPGGGKTGDIPQCGAIWADIDAGNQTAEDARGLLIESVKRLGIPAPNLLVRSGGGYHAYWLLSEVVPCAGEDEQKRIRETLSRLVHGIGGDLAGAHACQKATDVARILRLPGTFNRKIEGNPRPVVLVRCEPAKDNKPLVWWRAHLPALPLPPRRDPKKQGAPNRAPGELPPRTVEKMTTPQPDGRKHYAMVEVAVSCRKSGWDYSGIYNAVESCGRASGVDMNDYQQRRHAESIVEWAMSTITPEA